MAGPISVRCPHCNAKLKLHSEKVLDKRLPCPKCKKAIVLKAPSKPTRIEDPRSVTRCPHCNVKLKLPSTKVEGKKLPCPRCKKAIVLKASSKQDQITLGEEVSLPSPETEDKFATRPNSPADTDPGTNELSQTQSQISASAQSDQQPRGPVASPSVSLGELSGDLVPLDEDEQKEVEQNPRRDADNEEDDSEGLYRLSIDQSTSSPSPKPFVFDDADDDEWEGSYDEIADEAAAQTHPAVEATPDELDLMEAMEGLAEQEKSAPSRRRKKSPKHPTRKRKRP